jgi:hypothetical protein
MKTHMKFAVVAALLGVVSGARASAQDYSRLTLIRDDVTRNVVRGLIGGAFSRGVPTDPLMAKALEGVAKKASTAAIRDAMKGLEERLGKAQRALGKDGSTVDELWAGADALYIGVPEKTLRQMRAAAPRRSIALELGVLTELVAKNVPIKKASEVVLQLMARNATGVQLTALSTDVQGDVAAGLKPEVALDLRGRGILSLLPPPPSVQSLQGRPR